MDTIFSFKDETDNIKLNLDDLYERKKQLDLNTVNVFNKVLKRIHDKIKLTARQINNIQYCWFLVPEMILGVPRYDNGACIAYLIDKLRDNNFMIRYTHPNLLFISWKHWVPGYVRDEIRKKTGINIDGMGNEKKKNDNFILKNNAEPSDPNLLMFGNKSKSKMVSINTKKKDFRDIETYKPSGNLIYNKSLLEKIKDKTTL
uniref:Uncharacterized protein n=1 Tax=viral metagenome TaxID=1070528 RepID=A0A6C0JEK6_9ZZZZ